MLTKTQVVLDKARLVAPSGSVFFVQSVDDYENSKRISVGMPFETWQEIGAPLELTVTVEPGDRLNL